MFLSSRKSILHQTVIEQLCFLKCFRTTDLQYLQANQNLITFLVLPKDHCLQLFYSCSADIEGTGQNINPLALFHHSSIGKDRKLLFLC